MAGQNQGTSKVKDGLKIERRQMETAALKSILFQYFRDLGTMNEHNQHKFGVQHHCSVLAME
jgi:hypothetical protein